MTYPSFPAAGQIPSFFHPFDPSFQIGGAGPIAVIIGTPTTPVPGIAGGAVVVDGQWDLSVSLNHQSPRQALFGWQWIGVVHGAGFASASAYWPTINGPRRGWWCTDEGGSANIG